MAKNEKVNLNIRYFIFILNFSTLFNKVSSSKRRQIFISERLVTIQAFPWVSQCPPWRLSPWPSWGRGSRCPLEVPSAPAPPGIPWVLSLLRSLSWSSVLQGLTWLTPGSWFPQRSSPAPAEFIWARAGPTQTVAVSQDPAVQVILEVLVIRALGNPRETPGSGGPRRPGRSLGPRNTTCQSKSLSDDGGCVPDVTGKAVELDGGVESPELFLQLVDGLGQPRHLGLLSVQSLLN